jgi:uncharacterized LabA/DUF88 family protein
MDHRYAILIDGGFFTRKLYTKIGKRHPTVDDVVAAIDQLRGHSCVAGYELLRTYYYDAMPATGKIKHPITGVEINLAETQVYERNKAFLQRLELLADVSLRAGELSPHGYKLSPRALQDPNLAARLLTEADFVPNIEQKGVDLRIGLDIARLALRGLVRTVVVVTGDSDRKRSLDSTLRLS